MRRAREKTAFPPAVTDLGTLEARDDALMLEVDRVMEGAAEQAGDRWGCGPGRIDCCIGPFPVDALDARRLARGLEALRRDDPERARALEQRAEQAVELLREDFPGDPETGALGDDVDELLDACDWHEDLPCPVLDPSTGWCELYRWRPLVCRTFGPPLRVGQEQWKACPYCVAGTLDRIELDPHGRIDALCADVESATGTTGRTFIAFAVLPTPPERGETEEP
ncbi:MAG TPA: YkgJ family cysteine cluster protein [Thermoanaerobaculia bacterium]|nr:YkgJ family cysteine cluster protein [Thermoanaerobaculia bacterium]